MNEYNTLFGTKWNGAFGIGDNNITYMTSLQNELNLFKNKFSILGKINFGYTIKLKNFIEFNTLWKIKVNTSFKGLFDYKFDQNRNKKITRFIPLKPYKSLDFYVLLWLEIDLVTK